MSLGFVTLSWLYVFGFPQFRVRVRVQRKEYSANWAISPRLGVVRNNYVPFGILWYRNKDLSLEASKCIYRRSLLRKEALLQQREFLCRSYFSYLVLCVLSKQDRSIGICSQGVSSYCGLQLLP